MAVRVVAPVLVGREEPLRRLLTAVASPPSLVVVAGEAGIGKTRMVAELATHADLADRVVLSGSCRPIREPFPLGPIVEAVRDTGPRLAGTTLSPVAGALRGLLPELAAVLPPALEPLDDRAAERHRLFRGLVDVLRALGPVVLVAEDLHWADEQTKEFLGYLLGDPPPGLSVVLTFRSEAAAVPAGVVSARPADRVGVEHLVLGPLDAAQTRTLAAVILDSPQVSEEFAAYLCERASGSPLAIQELLALLRARGELIRWEGGWARRTLDALDVPAGVRDPVRERVRRLPAAARAVAEAAAVLQVPVALPMLAPVAGVPEVGTAVDELLEAGLLANSGDLVGFRHVLAAQAVYEGIPLSRRQQLHDRAAAAVERMHPVPLGQLARHLRHAGRADWIGAAERAADQASALGDEPEAARLLEDILSGAELAPERRGALTRKLGWIASEVLHVPGIRDLIGRALAAELPRATRGELRFLLATQLDKAGLDLARRDRLMAEAVADLDERPEIAAWAMLALGLPTTPELPFAHHKSWLERALPLLPRIADQATRLLLLGKIGSVFTAVGDRRWAEFADRIRADSGGRPHRRREINAYYSLGFDACLAGHHEVGHDLLAAALEATIALDPGGEMESRCRSALAMSAYFKGSWDGLDDESASLVRGLGGRYLEQLTAETVSACLALSRGELDAAASRLRAVARSALSHHDADVLPVPTTALLRLATARGEAGTALAETTRVFADCERVEVWPVAVRMVPALCEALLSVGRTGEAESVVERYAARLDGLDAPLAAPALAHARGHLAAAREQWAAAAQLFAQAADGYRELPAGYEAAQADEQAAVCLFAAGTPDAAEPALHRATTTYLALGARWDLDRVLLVARRHGLRPPQAARRDSAEGDAVLTGRQREVARLAATGLTNQQIGRELFLSPKTVDKHLGAALRKLGLHSRTQLRQHLGGTLGA